MKRVTWTVTCETLVATDNDEVARQQVMSLFENSQWGDKDGNQLCTLTKQEMQVRDVAEHRIYRPPPTSQGENSVRPLPGGLPSLGKGKP
jgi:hypothetical protein